MAQSQLMTHRIRFFIYEPTSINCIAFNQKLSKVALLRRPIKKYKPSQNDMPSIIEIWNLQQKAFFLEQTIYEDPDQSNLLESIAWSKSGRLFSCGLNSYLNEYDLINGRILKSYCVHSDASWCLCIDSNDELIALGTEKGFICIFKIFDDCLQFEKIMPKNENRVLCIEWYRPENDESNLFLVTGSIDFIKIFNYQQGKCVDFIKVGNNNVVVWCLKVLKDFTIVSGDSKGTISFWNGKTVTLIRSFNSHRGDVLSLCTSADEKFIYAAGVDPTIVQFNRCFNPNDTWIVSWKRRPHSHDVRSMVINENWLMSGGVDSFFSQISIQSSCHVSHLTNLTHKVAFASNDRHNFIGLMYEKFIQIWKLGTADNDYKQNLSRESLNSNNVFVTQLKLLDNAVKLLDIKSRKSINVFDFNTEWLIYSNYNNLKVVTWSEEKIEKIKILHDPISNISNICIIDENRFVITHGKNFDIFKLDRFGVVLEYSGVSQKQRRIHKILFSSKKLILITADKSNTVSIYDLKSQKYTLLLTFSNPMMPCACQISQVDANEKLWLSYANSMLVEYDLDELRQCKTYMLTKYKSNENKKCKSFNEHWSIKQIAFAKNSILLSDDNNLYAFNLERERITKCDKYHHIIAMANINQEELILVEITPQMIMSTLPPLLKTKSFGT